MDGEPPETEAEAEEGLAPSEAMDELIALDRNAW